MNSTNQLAVALTSNIKKLKELTDLYKRIYSLYIYIQPIRFLFQTKNSS